MPLSIAIQMDRPEDLKPETDSTFYVAKEAAARGYALFHYTPDALHVQDGRVRAHAHAARFKKDVLAFDLHEEKTLDLTEMDVVLMRQDPPFHMAYITATYLLERLQPEVLVLNDPAGVRNNPEKIFPLQFPHLIPPTLMTASLADIRAFQHEHGEIVVKDLYSYSGKAVYRFGKNDSVDEKLLENGLPLVVQRFLPEVKNQERRIVLLDGKIAGSFSRIPAEGDFRANTFAGGKVVAAEITSSQRRAAEEIGAVCKKLGLFFVGLDFIGEALIEINHTSPAGLTWLNKLYGTEAAKMFWDLAEKKL